MVSKRNQDQKTLYPAINSIYMTKGNIIGSESRSWLPKGWGMGGVGYKGAAQGKLFGQQRCSCILTMLVIIQLFAYRTIHKE